MTKQYDSEIVFRMILRDKLVETGYCSVSQWRNFSDAIQLIIKQEAHKETAEKVQKLKAELHINHNFHDLDFVDSIFGGKA